MIGLFLIIASIAGLLYWEMIGRDTVCMDQVLVARNQMEEGTVVTADMFFIQGIPKELVLEGGFHENDISSLDGLVTTQMIAKNSQIISAYFRKDPLVISEAESIFVLKKNWIAMRSSSLRRGDLVAIYGSVAGEYLGEYRVAYVKDESEREIRNADLELKPMSQQGTILNREDSTSIIDHIEIITTFDGFQMIRSYVNEGMGGQLILMQRSDEIGT